MEDKNVSSIDVHQIETTIKQISNSVQQAADGNDSLRKCLPTMMSEEIIGVAQQTPIPSLQQIHSEIQKAIEIDGETHVLTLLVKDALEKGMKGKHIKNKYNFSSVM